MNLKEYIKMDKELENKIREKWREQGYDYDVARLAFTLELNRGLKNGKEMDKTNS